MGCCERVNSVGVVSVVCQCSGSRGRGTQGRRFSLSSFSSSICVVRSVDRVASVCPLWFVLVYSFRTGDEFH